MASEAPGNTASQVGIGSNQQQMSASNISERPAFQTFEEGAQFDNPPFSRLAWVALAAGLFSLLAIFSTILLPAAMLAVAVGVVVVWKLSRDRGLAGLGLAQVGLALAALATSWSLTARSATDDYLFGQAGENAKIFLDTLASGKRYEALEFRQVESARQLTGTNLAKYYTSLSEEEREGVQAFLSAETTLAVIKSGPEADWQFVRGVSVGSQEQQHFVTVEMVNRAQGADARPLYVRMKRQVGLIADPAKKDSTALWNFEEMLRPK